MKNPNRNIIVEYKNKRARKGSASLWGNLDLKSIARQMEAEADEPQSPKDAQVPSKPIERNTVTTTIKAISQAKSVIEQVEEALNEPELPNLDSSIPEEVSLTMKELQPAIMVADAIVREKKPSVRRRMKKSAGQKPEAANRVVAEPDIQAELSALEIENSDLKRELAARLGSENRQLLKMLRRLER